jgi:hypothetical protein
MAGREVAVVGSRPPSVAAAMPGPGEYVAKLKSDGREFDMADLNGAEKNLSSSFVNRSRARASPQQWEKLYFSSGEALPTSVYTPGPGSHKPLAYTSLDGIFGAFAKRRSAARIQRPSLARPLSTVGRGRGYCVAEGTAWQRALRGRGHCVAEGTAWREESCCETAHHPSHRSLP